MTGVEYAVVRSGGRLVVLRADDPRSTSGCVFPANEEHTSYERARRFADACNEEKNRGKERVR